MTGPKYKAGQRVMIGRSKAQSAPRGRYRIVSAQPNPGGAVRYRIKGEVEQFERVVDETELEVEE